MKNFIEFVKKYKVHILSSLIFIFFFKSCINSRQVRKLEGIKTENVRTIDSLNIVINGQRDTIDNISEVIKMEKIKVHSEYDDYISSKDRGEQLMELHMVVKQNIKKLKNNEQ
jgi:hypothetical protein